MAGVHTWTEIPAPRDSRALAFIVQKATFCSRAAEATLDVLDPLQTAGNVERAIRSSGGGAGGGSRHYTEATDGIRFLALLYLRFSREHIRPLEFFPKQFAAGVLNRLERNCRVAGSHCRVPGLPVSLHLPSYIPIRGWPLPGSWAPCLPSSPFIYPYPGVAIAGFLGSLSPFVSVQAPSGSTHPQPLRCACRSL